MIITPAEFEDKMKAAESQSDALALMLKTLESLGYDAGISIWMNRFLFKELLQ